MSLRDNIIHCDATTGDGATSRQMICGAYILPYTKLPNVPTRNRAFIFGWKHEPPDSDYCVACARRRRLAAAGACSRKRRAEKQAKEETP